MQAKVQAYITQVPLNEIVGQNTSILLEIFSKFIVAVLQSSQLNPQKN